MGRLSRKLGRSPDQGPARASSFAKILALQTNTFSFIQLAKLLHDQRCSAVFAGEAVSSEPPAKPSVA
jgi:hypothetical protein